MDIKIIVGLSAGILTAVSALPQVFKLIKTKTSQDVSPWMYFVLIGGNGLWCYYGFLLNDLPIMITNAFSLVLDVLVIFLNYKYADKK